MSDHALYSPSSCYRNMACTASLYQILESQKAGFVEKISEYADEGTKAHELIALLLNNSTVDLGEYPDEMAYHAKAYISFLKGFRSEFILKYPNYHEWIERRVHFSGNMWGTVDYALIGSTLEKHEAILVDFKYGKGVEVSAEENLQLICYALCLEESTFRRFDKVTVCIYQPRLNPDPSTWTIDSPTLEHYRRQIVKNTDDCLRILYSEKASEEEYNVGDHCRFCHGKHTCIPRQNHLNSSALKVFDENPLPEKTSLTLEQRLKIFSLDKELRSFLDDNNAFLHAQASNGKKVPGYKLVEGRSIRKWKAEDIFTIGALQQLGVKDPATTKLKGITEIEREIGKNKIDHLVVYTKPSLQLVPEDDKRAEVKTMLDSIPEIENTGE